MAGFHVQSLAANHADIPTHQEPRNNVPGLLRAIRALVARLEVVAEQLAETEDRLDRQRRPYGDGSRDSWRPRR